MNARHKWRTRGRDDQLGVANIWRCSECFVFKCEHWPTETGDPDYEYSTPSGEVLVRGPRQKIRIPLCTKGRYIDR